jgi:hypothetical protein
LRREGLFAPISSQVERSRLRGEEGMSYSIGLLRHILISRNATLSFLKLQALSRQAFPFDKLKAGFRQAQDMLNQPDKKF